MQTLDPSWKIPTRPCPFYSQGKCFFSKNCSFLHDVKSTPTVIRVTAPDDDDYNSPKMAISPQRTVLSDTPQVHSHSAHTPNNDEEYGFDLDDYGSPDEEDSDVDSPTIRKAILSNPMAVDHSPSRDSVVTLKGGSHGSDTASTASRHASLPKFHPPPPRDSLTRTSRSYSTSSRRSSVKAVQLLPPFPESPAAGSVQTPSSATSATGQEVEVPTYPGFSAAAQFSLADAAASSLLANRLAKSRGAPLMIPSSPVPPAHGDTTTPYSAGALYESYHEDDTVHSSPFADAEPEVASPEPVSPTPQVVARTPTWLRPLRLASTLTPQTETQSSTSSNGISRQLTHNFSGSQSMSSLSTRSSVSPEPFKLYDSPISHQSSNESIYRRSTDSSNHIPTDTPHTIVLSDLDGSASPFSFSRSASVEIDTSHYPQLPASPESSVHRSPASQTSNTLSEMTGHSTRRRPAVPRIHTINPDSEGRRSETDAVPLSRSTTTSAEQFQSALERRAQRLKEGSRLMSSAELESQFPDSALDSQHLRSDSISAASIPDFAPSQSWSTLPHINTLSKPDIQHMTSLSDSLLMQQVQSSPPRTSPGLRPSPSVHATPSPDPSPRPHLLFAIASDQPAEVERLLSSGEASANETTGTGTGLLEFTVANEGLKNKVDIVKALLKYGADPGPLNDMVGGESAGAGAGPSGTDVLQSPVLAKKMEEAMNPALKYYLTRPQSLDGDSKPALEALQQSSFAPLARARFDIIGQDRALDEFYRVLGMHAQRKGRNALVILLCGPSGHGKSLLAQKVGSLLDVPTHTINMTALRSQHDLWQCLSTGIDDASPDLDLSEFLVQNQGKRCVVVLDEIEKVDDSKSLNPLLLPWDIGRCSLEQKKHTDTSKVMWIATSNLGQRIISEHVAEWDHPDMPPTRAEYTQLATAVRRRIAEILGASLLSRVTAVLPFLPFTEVEKIAIGTEAALSHGEYAVAPMSSADMEAMVRRAVKDVNFVEEEGARSLQRVVEIHLTTRT